MLTTVRSTTADRDYLRQRLAAPQRHRLLHGYPLPAAMYARPASARFPEVAYAETGRGLLVGVLPHPFCNPALTGCGFCTFPHEPYRNDQAAEVVARVAAEVEGRVDRQPGLHGRRVAGLYFGGGTANLSPAGPFRLLCRRLAECFDLSGAEVTLEGVPAYFVKRHPPLVDVLREELPARHFRLSMGIQTFDEDRLRAMGRHAFGNTDTFQAVVELAHGRGWTVSGDLLFDLPGQSLAEMRRDLEEALRIGLDHLGLYHLVLFRGLGTAWSRDPALVAAVPDNETAARNWVALREHLLSAGLVQTTLTNFERGKFLADERRFVYEEHSFQPDRFDMVGFGPGAISFAARPDFHAGLKTINPTGAAAYMAEVDGGGPLGERYFDYGEEDLRVFYLTRRLSALSIDRREYKARFGTDVGEDFGREVEALAEEGLLEVSGAFLRPTARGMFYADAVAAVLARRRIRARRAQDGGGWSLPLTTEEYEIADLLDGNSFGHM